MHILSALTLLLLLSAQLSAQPNFGPVRIDAGSDRTFFYPTVAVTHDGTLQCSWTSGSDEWMGAYSREADLTGVPVSAQDTVDLQSAAILTCPPRVTLVTLNSGAWSKLIYHE
ncbi:MAG: hypothetical protein IPG71_02935 [bacterium]|nr:hypothetical protein [bacterium]